MYTVHLYAKFRVLGVFLDHPMTVYGTSQLAHNSHIHTHTLPTIPKCNTCTYLVKLFEDSQKNE
jgi:hypothetical protein